MADRAGFLREQRKIETRPRAHLECRRAQVDVEFAADEGEHDTGEVRTDFRSLSTTSSKSA